MAFIEVNILDKVISAFENRGCELDDSKMTVHSINNGNFDMTYLKYHCFNITIYSSRPVDLLYCYWKSCSRRRQGIGMANRI